MGWLMSLILRIWQVLMVPAGETSITAHRPALTLYWETQYRCNAFAAGVVARIAVQEQDNKASVASSAPRHSLKRVLEYILLVFTYSYIGAAGYFSMMSLNMIPGSVILSRLWWAFQRPLYGVAVAYLLFLATSSHAPRLEQFLVAVIWRPIAALSYSAYLVQWLGSFGLNDKIIQCNAIQEFIKRPWSLNAVICINFLLFTFCSLLIALFLYAFIERPGIFLGKHVSAAFVKTVSHDSRTKHDCNAAHQEINSDVVPAARV